MNPSKGLSRTTNDLIRWPIHPITVLHNHMNPTVMKTLLTRRDFLRTSSAAMALFATAGLEQPRAAEPAGLEIGQHIYKSLKWDMVKTNGTALEKFALLKELGYDGVELDSPGGLDKKEAVEASKKTGLVVDGLVDSTHWTIRHSDPDPAVRAQALKNLETALRDAKFVGAGSVLLVPGKVTDANKENHDQVWERSIIEIRKALPLAEELKIMILIENVGNGFCGTPELMAKYVDEINHPWVGIHFDIGNHIPVSPPAHWVRVLGKRIQKLDVKDRKKIRRGGGAKIGDGDADWPELRKALSEIGYRGWAAAEVAGGDRARLADILERMNRVLGKSDGRPASPLRG
jgi:L-ribulose-5-phosphate 3-epimerase